MTSRIGSGIDIHQFSEDRKLILGGIEIAQTGGLLGHSDADVLLHAIIDAVLGALGWGDIGEWFPDTDAAFKDADSKELFRAVWQMATAEGWVLGNCDCTVMAEKPKLSPVKKAIRESIAGLFRSSVEQVNVKATTGEKLGFIGRGEGMLAQATVLLHNQAVQPVASS